MALALVVFALPSVFAASKVKLVVWGKEQADEEPDHAYPKALVQGFKAKYPDIDLEYVALGDGIYDKVRITMASGSGLPDIFQTWGGGIMGGYADAGRLLDLTSELKSVPSSPAAVSAVTWKGKIYGVAPFFGIGGLFVNEGLFKANALAVPTTIEDMEKACDVFLAKGIQPFACGAKESWPALTMYMYLVNRVGGDAFAQAKNRKTSFDSDGLLKAAQLYQSWAKKGYFGSAPLGEGYSDAQQLMATGKAAMQVTGTWMDTQYANKEFTDQTIGFYPFPILKNGGKGKITDVMGMTDVGFAATKAGAARKDAVVKFLKYAMEVGTCQADRGRICSVPGVASTNPLTTQASVVMSGAKSIQFWWDQDLPPAVTTTGIIQAFFIPTADLKKALGDLEALAVENLGPVKK